MTASKPHYLLFCDGNVSATGESAGSFRGRWRFVLEDLVSGERVEATDQESGCAPDRSALVAVLRGLEALEQPSRVTLVTTSRYVTRGLQYGLSEWRDNDYSWEHFGAVQPIRNADLWKRIDRALAYHQVQCRWMAQEGGADSQDEAVDDKTVAPTKEIQTAQVATTATIGSLASGVFVADPASATAQNIHRPSKTLEATRIGVSTSGNHRIYVDTPTQSSAASPIENIAIKLLNPKTKTTNLVGDSDPEKKVQRTLFGFFQRPILNSKDVSNLPCQPVRVVCSGPLWLCGKVWEPQQI